MLVLLYFAVIVGLGRKELLALFQVEGAEDGKEEVCVREEKDEKIIWFSS